MARRSVGRHQPEMSESPTIYVHITLLSRREWASTWMTLKAAFKAADMTMTSSERSERSLMAIAQPKKRQVPIQLSWVPCDRTKRIRRSHIVATETSCVPLQESTAETLCFFVLYPLDIPRSLPCPAGDQTRPYSQSSERNGVTGMPKLLKRLASE